MKEEDKFIVWLFNNYIKTRDNLFYDKLDHANVKVNYSLDQLRIIFKTT